MKYRKIPIISPGLIFVQKAFLVGVFSGGLIFGGAYYWKEFCVSKWVGLDNKNSLKHYKNSLKQLKIAITNSPWAYIREGLLSEGFLCLRFGRLIFLRAHHRDFTVFFFNRHDITRCVKTIRRNCTWIDRKLVEPLIS